MNRYKKEEQTKQKALKEEFIKKHLPKIGAILFECKEKVENIIEEYTRALHVKMFEEEYDFMCDDGVDANRRKKGENPMNLKYQNKVNAKREKLGFSALNKNGMPNPEDKTLEYCKNLVLSSVMESEK